MKKLIILFLVISSFIFTSCEEVIQVDTITAPPRLAVEAAINWQKGSSGNVQSIKLTSTTGYFETKIPVVSGAVVTIKNSSNTVFTFIETPNTGIYTCSDFIPVLNETYTLSIISNEQTYTATETMRSVAPITRLVQNDKGGFTGKDIEVKAYFNDPADEENFYLYRYKYKNVKKSDLYADEDTYYNGNEFFSITQNDSLKVGDKVDITHIGISKSYYNYMNIIISLAGQNGGGPFQSPPSTVRGNVVNTTNPNNYPLGYFSVSEIDSKEYTIQ
ncbi:DUF4249 family protein [Flavobacterium laiguense]|uniref:DUF4249 domain-containing protein n=1 Tax=Flavobacterium laiguense TaxID=2169409 RepID=A0A2U1JQ73_9FLAO|nr:DUF4249 family protein [Flavobacterium laiguense]PWA07124.1 DUF4249 domain-containing protein [Flavobacterium laiguense]